ncbi:predicted protein [Lichtheimia corymbifera JMRC:FSU:9682]|uniref:Uncharacterized protein n=1 Tax=Lichtheimia corymbifera JMRC:FSU:9682 TaxID=1263082 RepID=A0A068SA88_9FUNG|nr:predicted protein [Lichtheimia corymbifera JMRC:FSU:9682]
MLLEGRLQRWIVGMINSICDEKIIAFAAICALWHAEGVTVDPSEGKLGVQLHCDYSHSLVATLFLHTRGFLAQVIVGGNGR